MLVGGLILLGGALLVTLGTGDEPRWRMELATVLVGVTAVYLVSATIVIVRTFVDQMSPRRFTSRLTRPTRVKLVGRERSWTSEELYRVLRVLRGWLRTVNRVGESRDLQFGLEGVLKLIKEYAREVRAEMPVDGDIEPSLHRAPSDYRAAKGSPVTQLPCLPADRRTCGL